MYSMNDLEGNTIGWPVVPLFRGNDNFASPVRIEMESRGLLIEMQTTLPILLMLFSKSTELEKRMEFIS